nr:hypothetical protein Iba_chr05dCG2870 [Ipomoea batatas]
MSAIPTPPALVCKKAKRYENDNGSPPKNGYDPSHHMLASKGSKCSHKNKEECPSHKKCISLTKKRSAFLSSTAGSGDCRSLSVLPTTAKKPWMNTKHVAVMAKARVLLLNSILRAMAITQ